jgi:predicted nucleic acid-binding protein
VTDAILDTTFFIDLRYGDTGAEKLWESVQDGSLTAAFSVITAFELWAARESGSEAEEFYLNAFDVLEEAVLTKTAAIQAGIWLRQHPRETHNARLRDALIGASARERGEPVYTRNVRDFARFSGVQIETY